MIKMHTNPPLDTSLCRNDILLLGHKLEPLIRQDPGGDGGNLDVQVGHGDLLLDDDIDGSVVLVEDVVFTACELDLDIDLFADLVAAVKHWGGDYEQF